MKLELSLCVCDGVEANGAFESPSEIVYLYGGSNERSRPHCVEWSGEHFRKFPWVRLGYYKSLGKCRNYRSLNSWADGAAQLPLLKVFTAFRCVSGGCWAT